MRVDAADDAVVGHVAADVVQGAADEGIVGTTMAVRRRPRQATGPVSVALSPEQRERLVAEARRRGLGVSPTMRTLALERVAEIEAERQLARARQWQLERARELVDEIERGQVGEATWDEIDRIFDEALDKKRPTDEGARR